MDYMDIDQVLDVPDTPDRLIAQNINGGDRMKKDYHSSMTTHSGEKNFSDEGVRNLSRDKNKLRPDIGSRRLLIRPPKNLIICDKPDKSECHSNSTISVSQSSFSSKHALRCERMVADKTVNHEKHSIHSQSKEKRKAFCTSQPQGSACQEDIIVVDLTEQNGQAQVFEEAIPCGTLRNSRAEEFRMGAISANSFSSSHSTTNSSLAFNDACKVKGKVDDTCEVGPGFDRGKGLDFTVDSQPKDGKDLSRSLYPITSRRVTGQKRLVRNGCISPHNIAKAKQSTEKYDRSSVHAEQNDTGTVDCDGPSSLISVRDLIAEANESHRVKGKGVINHPFPSEEAEAKIIHSSNRSSTALGEKVNGTIDARRDEFRCFEGLGGWRSTRNRTSKINPPLSDKDQHLSRGISRGKDDPFFVNQQHANGVVRRDYRSGSNARNRDDYPMDQDSVSFQHVSAPPLAQTAFQLRHQLGQFNEQQHAANTHIKRQKQGSTSSNHGECSSSAIDDSEIALLGSSGKPSNLRSTRNQNRHVMDILDPVTEIDEFSPEIRNSGSHNICCSSNDDSDVRARQVEADELLARELQVQLYNEVAGVGVGEIDAHVALTLQQEENSQRAFSRGSHHVFHPRGSLISNLNRQSQSRSSQNPSTRRGILARFPTSNRERLRRRFPGQSRTLASRERNSMFPPNVDVDMRIHILEALEAVNDMGMAGNFLRVQRDFNEDDYEMLLALDENNHHVGASLAQINGLPQSTVQIDNLEECAICLETPSIGDTIRHLPCLHRFHKDCIDPWLRRRTSCPVCKSSIT